MISSTSALLLMISSRCSLDTDRGESRVIHGMGTDFDQVSVRERCDLLDKQAAGARTEAPPRRRPECRRASR